MMGKLEDNLKNEAAVKNQRINSLALYSLLLSSLVLFANCSYRTPAIETPAPGPQDSTQGVDKTFFGTYEQKQVKNAAGKLETTDVWMPKTFLCGWASLEEVGSLAKAKLLHNVNNTKHCNLQFEITENALIGRKIDPTHPVDEKHPDARKLWKQVVSIPIVSHYYYEREKDAQGRETNRYIENDQRSDYRARPKIKLDLKGTSIVSLNDTILNEPGQGLGSFSITGVDDIEWDLEKGFLGYNATIVSPSFGSEGQARLRFNFLEFKSNPNFKATRYNDKNSNYFNALHILGKRAELDPVLYVGKWDTEKTHDIYLYGFPEKYVSIAEDTVNAWNDAFAEIERNRPFKINKTKMKYPFDLRYPMIVWVEDKEIALSSPIGIAMSQADVTNGEIVWGGVVLWGGGLENYVKSNTLTSSTSASANGLVASLMPTLLDLGPDFLSPSPTLNPPPDAVNFSKQDALAHLQKYFRARAPLSGAQAANGETQMPVEGLSDTVISAVSKQMAKMQAMVNGQFTRQPFTDMLPIPRPDSEATKSFFGEKVPEGTTKEQEAQLRNRIYAMAEANGHGAAIDRDQTFAMVGPWWNSAISDLPGDESVKYENALRSVIKHFTMHEMGHFIGLGHQFKENILPERGTIPDSEWLKLDKKVKQGNINFTSAMGYKSGITDVLTPYEDIGPGPHDKLVMQYIYNNKFATVKIDRSTGKVADDRFHFFDMPAGGEVPVAKKDQPEYVTRYFPACNDLQAVFSADPFCNRWDRGHDAKSIVENYFDSMNSNLISRLISFTDARGGNTDHVESFLWYTSYNFLGRVRLFYDYMRQTYAEPLSPILQDKNLAYAFASSCREENPTEPYLAKVFKDYPDLKKLCQVNSYALNEMQKFLTNSGPDYSEIDYDNAVVPSGIPGGDARQDQSRFFGTRRTLTVLPRKIAALNALTTPRPYFFYGPWMAPVPRFSEASNGKFVYSSLYPEQFTQAIAATVEKNLKFKKERSDIPNLGRAALSLGYFLNQNFNFSGESGRVDNNILEELAEQTNFEFKMVAIIFKKVVSSNDLNRVIKFTVSIFDFVSGRATTAREGYILRSGKVIVRGPERTFVLPITKFTFADDETGIALAYTVNYNPGDEDMLESHGLKAKFEILHKELLDNCIGGMSKKGLQSYFKGNEQSAEQKDGAAAPAEGAAADDKPAVAEVTGEFQGFEVIPGIATDDDKQRKFFDSVRTSFDAYYGQKDNPPDRNACDDSLEGLGLLVSEAALLNGHWIPEVMQYVH